MTFDGATADGPSSGRTGTAGLVMITDATAVDPGKFGGKGAALAQLARAGLPVPEGFLIAAEALEGLAQQLQQARRPATGERVEDPTLARASGLLDSLGPVAVRSSALREDGARRAAAGQYATVLGVTSLEKYWTAVEEVVASQYTDHVRAYWGLGGEPTTNQVAILTQRLVKSRTSGVLFTRDPVTGTNTHVIESCVGLGLSVVDGDGVLERSTINPRTLEIVSQQLRGRGFERHWDDAQERVISTMVEHQSPAPLLSPREHAVLVEAGRVVEHVLETPVDIEWAFEGDTLWILQARPITALLGTS
jgi:phosphoenolpyruvate synthase/pyruvate phosphate dikinase